jgi:hypothetical protein
MSVGGKVAPVISWSAPPIGFPAPRLRCACIAQTQFSTLIPGMRLNSRMLLVTMISPSLRA